MRKFSNELRWTIIVFVLAVAGVIALWPDTGPTPPGPGTGAPTTTTPSTMEDDVALAAPRHQAALEPCPNSATTTRGSGPLAGITVPCLGNPGNVDLAAALSGKPAMLNLWASWCQPCRAEMPALNDYARQPNAIPVIGINVQDHPTAALELLAEVGVHYPSVVDTSSELQRALKAPAVLPVNYLLRPDGSVQHITDPLMFRSAQQVEETVNRYLTAPS